MNVLMLIWSYWPGPQGGAERQCRLISQYIVLKNCTCTIVTAKLSLKDKSREYDGLTSVRRVGHLLPFLNTIKSIFEKWGERILSGRSTGCRARQQDLHDFDKYRQKMGFWLALPWVWLGRLNFICELFFWIYKNRSSINIIHAHESGWLGAVAILFGKLFNIEVVCKSATLPPFPQIGWDVPFRMILRTFQRRSHLIVLNQIIREQLVHDGFPSSAISVIPNAVYIPSCCAFPEQSNKVLYVGNFSQGAYLKAFDVLFKAWSIVHRKNDTIRLVVAGGGDVTFWKNLVFELGCSATVEFLGFVSDPAILYEKAGLFVLPSRVEGMSNALLEALSYGLPVVASDISPNQAVIDQTESAVLVEVGNEKALAEAILMLMADPQRRAKMGKCGRHLVEKRHLVETIAVDLVSLYQDLIDKKKES